MQEKIEKIINVLSNKAVIITLLSLAIISGVIYGVTLNICTDMAKKVNDAPQDLVITEQTDPDKETYNEDIIPTRAEETTEPNKYEQQISELEEKLTNKLTPQKQLYDKALKYITTMECYTGTRKENMPRIAEELKDVLEYTYYTSLKENQDKQGVGNMGVTEPTGEKTIEVIGVYTDYKALSGSNYSSKAGTIPVDILYKDSYGRYTIVQVNFKSIGNNDWRIVSAEQIRREMFKEFIY